MTDAPATTSAPAAQPAQPTQPPKNPQFPPHNAPRVWLLTNGASPISINLARYLLAHGDYVVTAVPPTEVENEEARAREFTAFLDEVRRQGLRDKRRASGPVSEHGDAASAVDLDNVDADEKDTGGEGSTKQNGKGFVGGGGGVKMKPWRERIHVVPLEIGSVSDAQSAVAEAMSAFGMGIDIMLLTTSSVVLGTVEELAQTAATQTLIRDQFETNFFANVNLIKAALPAMRERKNGHIILLSSITGHLGTPGLATHCASTWAMEGYCDSLAFEIAPFNVKTTIVQPNIEIGMLTNKLTSVPPMVEYSPEVNHAPFQREIIANLLDRLEGAVLPEEMTIVDRKKGSMAGSSAPMSARDSSPTDPDAMETPTSSSFTVSDNPDVGSGLTTGDLLSSPTITSLYPPLTQVMQTSLVAETVFALAAIGGHDNPPARHIVGHEGIISVKEKLKTVSEELEDFLEVSGEVDFPKADGEPAGG